ncbi:MAG: DRTGG domain-containing protein [candidate division WOR-3 bacterium]|nr:DRTGG domain-containing protein [candidate division WOR-3 bacterium]
MRETKLSEIISSLNLKMICGEENIGCVVSGGYVSDLLSDVMANAKKGNIWVTLQTHPNIVAVAVLKEISGVIIPGGRKPEPETIKKAEQEKIPIMTTELSGFEIVGRLYGILNK